MTEKMKEANIISLKIKRARFTWPIDLDSVVDQDRSNMLPRCILFSVYQQIHKVRTWCNGNKQ
jgi:hypothetical protein